MKAIICVLTDKEKRKHMSKELRDQGMCWISDFCKKSNFNMAITDFIHTFRGKKKNILVINIEIEDFTDEKKFLIYAQEFFKDRLISVKIYFNNHKAMPD